MLVHKDFIKSDFYFVCYSVMVRVAIIQDSENQWYIIPYHKLYVFEDLLRMWPKYSSQLYNEFNEYIIWWDINSWTELYIKSDS